jgi:ribonuclease P protein subunit RPR2
MPGMPDPSAAARRGRRGRRTGAMIRIARERIADLFALAEQEARRGDLRLPNRYVTLARRVGMRYNVRLLVEYRDAYCRGCSAYWLEGRTVRTRLRSGRRTQTCLRCGRVRRMPLRRRTAPSAVETGAPSPGTDPEPVPATSDEMDDLGLDEGEEE